MELLEASYGVSPTKSPLMIADQPVLQTPTPFADAVELPETQTTGFRKLLRVLARHLQTLAITLLDGLALAATPGVEFDGEGPLDPSLGPTPLEFDCFWPYRQVASVEIGPELQAPTRYTIPRSDSQRYRRPTLHAMKTRRCATTALHRTTGHLAALVAFVALGPTDAPRWGFSHLPVAGAG
jgi:hypothetical protein